MIIEQVLGTRNNESKWLCLVRCYKHATGTRDTLHATPCVTCNQVHVLRASTAKNYIRMQVKQKIAPEPTFLIEWTGTKCKNLRRHNRDPKLIYHVVKFVGFKRPQLEVYQGGGNTNNNPFQQQPVK